jgi:truncated hemoglobin YjbI
MMKSCRQMSEKLTGWSKIRVFEAIGGQKAINSIVNNMYEKLANDIVLAPAFKNTDLTRIVNS